MTGALVAALAALLGPTACGDDAAEDQEQTFDPNLPEARGSDAGPQVVVNTFGELPPVEDAGVDEGADAGVGGDENP